jgi:hypothetical protein
MMDRQAWISLLKQGYFVGETLEDFNHNVLFETADRFNMVVALPSPDGGEYVFGGLYTGRGSEKVPTPYMSIIVDPEGLFNIWVSEEVDDVTYFPCLDDVRNTYGLGVVFTPPDLAIVPVPPPSEEVQVLFTHIWVGKQNAKKKWVKMSLNSMGFNKIYHLGSNKEDGDVFEGWYGGQRYILRGEFNQQ